VHTLLTDPLLPHHYALDAIVATVDGQHGLSGHEAVSQAAAADTLVVTKTDLATAGEVAALERELEELNPTARTVRAVFGAVDPSLLLTPSQRDLRALAEESGHEHEDGVRAVTLTLDRSVDWTAFGVWLTMLLHARGEDVLRVKGLLDTGGDGPLLVNCVRHAVHPPVHLDAWPAGDRGSRLVVIGRGFTGGELEASLTAFDAAARG
jgi:G3E family GTPase